MFDDEEQEGEEQLPGYVGVAQAPLHDLSLGKNISGSFQLKQVRHIGLKICSKFYRVGGEGV